MLICALVARALCEHLFAHCGMFLPAAATIRSCCLLGTGSYFDLLMDVYVTDFCILYAKSS